MAETPPAAGETGDLGSTGDATPPTDTLSRADVEKLVGDRVQAVVNAMPKRFEAILDQRLKALTPTTEPDPTPTGDAPPVPKPDERIAKLEATIEAQRQREKVLALQQVVGDHVVKDAVDMASSQLAARIRVNDDGSRTVVEADGQTPSYSDDGTKPLTVEDLVKRFVADRPGLARKPEPRKGVGFQGTSPQVPRTGEGQTVEDLRAESNRIELEAQKLEQTGSVENLEAAARLRRTLIPLERQISDLREQVPRPI